MARYPDETIAEIKQRTRLSDLIGRTVSLKKSGRDFKGLSPFSNEKTPSFIVHDQQGFWKCFSTQKGGDCFTWLMETQRMTFSEAVEKLAAEAGVPLTASTPQDAAAADRRRRILESLEWAQGIFSRSLFWSDHEDAHAARDYVLSRGFKSNAEITAAGLGWAPTSAYAMRDLAAKQGISLEALEAAGVLKKGENGQLRAFYRNRITLPVHDHHGRIVGFTARALAPNAQPKYLNGPDTEVFTKGEVLFNLHHARTMLAKGGDLHAVEGCFDVTTMQRHGFAACAPLGTALTESQLQLLWRVTASPVLCFDGDAAGLRAARRSAERGLAMLRAGRSLRFMMLEAGQDPDSLLRAGGMLPAPVAHFDVMWDAWAEALNLQDPNDRGRFRTRVKHALDSMVDKSMRKEWAAAIAYRFAPTAPAPPRAAAPAPDQRQALTREQKRAPGSRLVEPEATAAALLGCLLDAPERVDRHQETLAGIPAGRFAPLRDWLLEGEQGRAGLLQPWADELMAELRGAGARPVAYSAEGWERAARALIARHGQG